MPLTDKQREDFIDLYSKAADLEGFNLVAEFVKSLDEKGLISELDLFEIMGSEELLYPKSKCDKAPPNTCCMKWKRFFLSLLICLDESSQLFKVAQQCLRWSLVRKDQLKLMQDLSREREFIALLFCEKTFPLADAIQPEVLSEFYQKLDLVSEFKKLKKQPKGGISFIKCISHGFDCLGIRRGLLANRALWAALIKEDQSGEEWDVLLQKIFQHQDECWSVNASKGDANLAALVKNAEKSQPKYAQESAVSTPSPSIYPPLPPPPLPSPTEIISADEQFSLQSLPEYIVREEMDRFLHAHGEVRRYADTTWDNMSVIEKLYSPAQLLDEFFVSKRVLFIDIIPRITLFLWLLVKNSQNEPFCAMVRKLLHWSNYESSEYLFLMVKNMAGKQFMRSAWFRNIEYKYEASSEWRQGKSDYLPLPVLTNYCFGLLLLNDNSALRKYFNSIHIYERMDFRYVKAKILVGEYDKDVMYETGERYDYREPGFTRREELKELPKRVVEIMRQDEDFKRAIIANETFWRTFASDPEVILASVEFNCRTDVTKPSIEVKECGGTDVRATLDWVKQHPWSYTYLDENSRTEYLATIDGDHFAHAMQFPITEYCRLCPSVKADDLAAKLREFFIDGYEKKQPDNLSLWFYIELFFMWSNYSADFSRRRMEAFDSHIIPKIAELFANSSKLDLHYFAHKVQGLVEAQELQQHPGEINFIVCNLLAKICSLISPETMKAILQTTQNLELPADESSGKQVLQNIVELLHGRIKEVGINFFKQNPKTIAPMLKSLADSDLRDFFSLLEFSDLSLLTLIKNYISSDSDLLSMLQKRFNVAGLAPQGKMFFLCLVVQGGFLDQSDKQCPIDPEELITTGIINELYRTYSDSIDLLARESAQFKERVNQYLPSRPTAPLISDLPSLSGCEVPLSALDSQQLSSLPAVDPVPSELSPELAANVTVSSQQSLVVDAGTEAVFGALLTGREDSPVLASASELAGSPTRAEPTKEKEASPMPEVMEKAATDKRGAKKPRHRRRGKRMLGLEAAAISEAESSTPAASRVVERAAEGGKGCLNGQRFFRGKPTASVASSSVSVTSGRSDVLSEHDKVYIMVGEILIGVSQINDIRLLEIALKILDACKLILQAPADSVSLTSGRSGDLRNAICEEAGKILTTVSQVRDTRQLEAALKILDACRATLAWQAQSSPGPSISTSRLLDTPVSSEESCGCKPLGLDESLI